MHSLRITVWCGFQVICGVIEPFFIETDKDTAVTVNGE